MSRKVKIHNVLDFNYLQAIVSLEEWCERYSITPISSKCLKCDEIRTTTVPAFGKTWRGLIAPPCICGHDGPYQHYVLTSDAEVDGFLQSLHPTN